MRTLILSLLCVLLVGCAGPGRADLGRNAPVPDVRQTVTIYDGSSGSPLSWADALNRIGTWQIALLGETHDDDVGHAIQLAILEDLGARGPIHLAMEMLERDEQLIVDDHLDDIITGTQLASLTNSSDWAGDGSWTAWYQPLIDAARASGGRVIAANAPRRYVRRARTDGFEFYDTLDPARRAFVEVPTGSFDAYRARFGALMNSMREESGMGPAADAALDATFRSQLVWDATMGDSVVRAWRDGASPIALVVGSFHVEHDGGTRVVIERAAPGARVGTMLVVADPSDSLRDEERDGAEIVIYAGISDAP